MHKTELKDNGFSIIKNAVDVELVQNLRKEFLNYKLKEFSSNIKPVLWNPVLGEENRNGYDNDSHQKMLRRFCFTWNKKDKFDSKIFSLLNSADSEIEHSDIAVSNKRKSNNPAFGTYDTISYYPEDGGWLYQHVDGLENDTGEILIQVIIPLTFKQKDYHQGGLYVISRTGEKIYLDDHVNPGDIMILNGSFKHGVDKIKSDVGIGRLHVFRIATYFENPMVSERFISEISMFKFCKIKFKQVLIFSKKVIKSIIKK
jgi:hypothetical protein